MVLTYDENESSSLLGEVRKECEGVHMHIRLYYAHKCTRVCVWVYLWMQETSPQSIRSQTVHWCSDKLYSPFQLPKPEADDHKQTNTVKRFRKYTEDHPKHLIQLTLATDHKWNLCVHSPVSLWARPRSWGAHRFNADKGTLNSCALENHKLFLCVLWSNLCGWIFQANTGMFPKKGICLVPLSKNPVKQSHVGLAFCLVMCLWDGSITSMCVSHSNVSDSATPWTVCSPPGSPVRGILQARILQ